MPWYFILLIALVIAFALALIIIGTHEAIVYRGNSKNPDRGLYNISSLSFTLEDEGKNDVDVLFAGSLVEIFEAKKENTKERR